MPKYEFKLNENYNIDSEHFISIEEGKFKDFHFMLGAMRFQGQDENGNGRIAFNYELLSHPEGVTLNKELQQEFEKEISEVIKSIMEDILAQEENEVRDTDIESTYLL